MLGMLIKHELRVTSRIIPIFFLAVAAAVVPTAIFSTMNNTVMSLIFASLLMLAGILLTYGSIIYLVIRFYRGVYGSEGYLAMTLPVDEKHIFFSRGIVASLWTVLCSVCFIATYFYAFKTMIYCTQETAEEIGAAMSMFGGKSMCFLLILTIIGNLLLLAEAYLCITIAHVRPFRKLGLGAAVISYLVIYFVQQILTLLLTMFVPLGVTYTPDAGWSFTNTTMFSSINRAFSLAVSHGNAASDMSTSIGIASVFLFIAAIIICPAVTAHLMKKKINLR